MEKRIHHWYQSQIRSADIPKKNRVEREKQQTDIVVQRSTNDWRNDESRLISNIRKHEERFITSAISNKHIQAII